MWNEEQKLKLVGLIEDAAARHFACGQPYLLSKLGSDLGEEGRAVKGSPEKTLANFIRVHLADKFEVILTGRHGNIQAIIPKDGEFPTSGSNVPSSPPRYHPRFWAAFAVPASAKPRWFDIGSMRFEDSDSPASGDFIEVDREFIATDDQSNRDSFIKLSIDSWLEKNSIDSGKVIARSGHEATGFSANSGKSLLEAMIETLDVRQLANTQMTLDVIAALMRKRR